MSTDISIFWALPFVSLLACIALMPFVARHFWEHHYPKISFALAALVAGYYFLGRGDPAPWLKEMKEYVSFIVLLASLYVVSGGIAIRINRRASPIANGVLLLIGAVLANVFGTTGAAMLLIRPYLRMNRRHIRPYHVVFFIFVVANTGGSLTPIGDPPLFLGYLKGVPFWWVLDHMLYPWAMVVGLLVGLFVVIDAIDHRRAARAHAGDPGPQVKVTGVHNFLFIVAILYGVFRPSVFEPGARFPDLIVAREVVMLTAAVASRYFTARAIYEANDFNFGPIREVGILFVGIFSTMVPALQWLEHNAEKMHVTTPGQYYFASGALSSVLDNAPTYLTFLQTRIGELDRAEVDEADAILRTLEGRDVLAFDSERASSDAVRGAVGAMIAHHPDEVRRGSYRREYLEVAFLVGVPSWNVFLVAISAGSVFWGACTYIGNGPNFMVKSIADASGVRTPGFLRYVYGYAVPILVPIYVLVWWVFFARAG